MALEDPIAAYNAATNMDAVMTQQFLESQGIEAFVTEDNSLVGHWIGGLLPEIHKPQVWVSRVDTARVAELLAQYESHRAANQSDSARATSEDVAVHCDECGCDSTFSRSLDGTIQDCPHCGSTVDVGGVEWPYGSDWETAGDDEGAPDQ